MLHKYLDLGQHILTKYLRHSDQKFSIPLFIIAKQWRIGQLYKSKNINIYIYTVRRVRKSLKKTVNYISL